MIELNPISLVLLVEVLIAMLLLVFGLFLFYRNKNLSEQVAAHQLIDKLEDSGGFKINKLSEIMTQKNVIEPATLEQLLSEINSNDRVLYQQVIQLLISKDVKLLQKINQTIDKLSEPYFQLLSYSSIDVEDKEKLEVAESKVQNLAKEYQRLDGQLKEAMKQINEISAEYTRVFTGTQTEEELELSSQKMLKAFKDCERRSNASFKTLEQ